MAIFNYNDKVRYEILKEYESLFDINKDLEDSMMDVYDMYEKLSKKKNFKYIIGTLYTINYVYAKKCDYISSYVFDDEIDDINKVIKEIDHIDFDDLCNNAILFNNKPERFKRECFKSIMENKDDILDKYPFFILDIISNSYDDVLEEYYFQNKIVDDSNIAIKRTSYKYVDNLNNIKNKDKNEYFYKLFNIIDECLEYLNYLYKNSNKTESIEALLNIIYDNVENISNVVKEEPYILIKFIDYYLEYKLLNKEENKKVKDYYKNNNDKLYNNVKSRIKILKNISN